MFSSNVCIKHFREENILRTFEIHQAEGSIQHIARSKPKLLDTAIPCILPECPKNLSYTANKPARLTYESKEQELFDEAVRASIAEQIAEEEKFKLRDFKDLIEKLLSLSLPDNCIQWYSDKDTLQLIRLSFTEPAV